MNKPLFTPDANEIRSEAVSQIVALRDGLLAALELDYDTILNAEDPDDLEAAILYAADQSDFVETLWDSLSKAMALGAVYARPDLLASPAVALSLLSGRFEMALSRVAEIVDAERAASTTQAGEVQHG